MTAVHAAKMTRPAKLIFDKLVLWTTETCTRKRFCVRDHVLQRRQMHIRLWRNCTKGGLKWVRGCRPRPTLSSLTFEIGIDQKMQQEDPHARMQMTHQKHLSEAYGAAVWICHRYSNRYMSSDSMNQFIIFFATVDTTRAQVRWLKLWLRRPVLAISWCYH
jgi:hypothetical protein